MINYIVFENRQEAEFVNREFYKLSIGEKINDGWSQYMFSMYEHPNGQLVALMINGDVIFPMAVNPSPNPEKLIDFLKKIGDITTEVETEEIRAKCFNGSIIKVIDIIPAKTRERFKTYEQMQADGWFVESSEV